MLNFQMNNGDRFDNLNASETGFDVRGWSIPGDPLKDVLYGSTVFHTLAVAGDGGRRMESGTHEIAVARPGACDIAVHGTSDRVVLREIAVGIRSGAKRGRIAGDFRRGARTLRA